MPQIVGSPRGHKRVRCPACLVLIKYAPIEVKHRIVSDYGGGSDSYYWINCPKCHHEITVEPVYL